MNVKSKILVTDDSQVTLFLVREFLEENGFEVLTAHDGREAIRMAVKLHPDLILLDVTMPGIDGYETCKLLKSNPVTALAPVIFFSANTDQLNKVKAFESGAVDYVNKPIEFVELIERIKTHLKIALLQNELLIANSNLENQVKERTKQLNESEQKFRTIAESSVFGVLIFKEKILYVNDAFCKIIKESRDLIIDFSTSKFAEVFHPDDLPLIQAEMQKKANGNMSYVSHYECRIIDRLKNVIWVEINSRLIHLNGEQVTFTTLLDITEKKQTEKKLTFAHTRFFNVLEMLPSFVCLLKQDRTITYANQKFKDIFGEDSPEEKKCFAVFHHSDEPCSDCQTMNVFNTKQRQEWEWQNPETGKDYIISTHFMLDADDSPRALKFGFDVTDLKRAEREILKVQQQLQEHKLLSVIIETEEKERQKFAQELHDGLGPLLSTGKIYIHNIKSTQDEKLKKISIEKIFEIFEASLTSIKEIANNISPHVLKNFGLSAAVESFIDKCRPAAKAKINLHSTLSGRTHEIVEITAYRFITEMINNSFKYSECDTIEITINSKDSQLIVEYSDNGKGFDFEAEKQKKSGFGLVNIENRVKTMDGKFAYFSTKGKGIKAGIRLPM